MAALVERAADARDPPVHHVARRHDVGPGARVDERHLGQDLDRRVVVDLPLAVLALAQDPAVAVVGVLVDADVGHDDEAGRCLLHRLDGARDRTVGVEAARPARVLRLGETEEEDTANPSFVGLFRVRRGGPHRKLRDARHRPDGAGLVEGGVEEEGPDEVARGEVRLPDEGAQGGGRSQAARAVEGEGHGGASCLG